MSSVLLLYPPGSSAHVPSKGLITTSSGSVNHSVRNDNSNLVECNSRPISSTIDHSLSNLPNSTSTTGNALPNLPNSTSAATDVVKKNRKDSTQFKKPRNRKRNLDNPAQDGPGKKKKKVNKKTSISKTSKASVTSESPTSSDVDHGLLGSTLSSLNEEEKKIVSLSIVHLLMCYKSLFFVQLT